MPGGSERATERGSERLIDVLDELDAGPKGDNKDSDLTENQHPSDLAALSFVFLENARFRPETDRGLQMLFVKWGLGQGVRLGRFRFEPKLPAKADARHVVAGLCSSGQLRRFGFAGVHDIDVDTQILPIATSHTSMDLFSRLEEEVSGPAVHKNTGLIKGRLDEFPDNGIVVNSVLRECLFMEESELYDAFSDSERNEFLFKIFSHLVHGGATNQYEDHIHDYLKAAKAMYRDLVSVRKDGDGDGDLKVTSEVFEVPAGEKGLVNNHPLSFAYFIVDRFQRYVTVWAFGYTSAWG